MLEWNVLGLVHESLAMDALEQARSSTAHRNEDSCDRFVDTAWHQLCINYTSEDLPVLLLSCLSGSSKASGSRGREGVRV